MLLRFSIDAGVTYYSDLDPRITVPLDGRSSRRMQNTYPRPCFPPCQTLEWNRSGDKNKESLDPSYGNGYAFDTCFKFGKHEKYCWTQSFYCSSCYSKDYYACYPAGGYDTWWHSVDQDDLMWPNNLFCGGPCLEVESYGWGDK